MGFKFYIELNNRKILDGLLLDAEIKEKDFFSITVSIDKLKKIGKKGVTEELTKKGFKKDKIKFILESLALEKTNRKTLLKLKKIVKNEKGKQGIQEMQELFEYLEFLDIKSYIFDPSLARGLAYYTGPIFEVFLKDSSITSSAAGGGRYDRLIANYLGRKEDFPATGFSFGVEVIVEAMKEKNLANKKSVSKVFILPIKTFKESLKIAKQLRDAGINTDIDLLNRDISKNLKYANAYEIPYVIFVGQNELKEGKLKLRDMKTGKEEMLSVKNLIEKLN